jgi:hypothetical protein
VLEDFEQEEDQNDGEDERDASAAVIAEPWSHAITTEAEHKDQNDQKKDHVVFSPFGEDSPDEGVMQIPEAAGFGGGFLGEVIWPRFRITVPPPPPKSVQSIRSRDFKPGL